MKGFAWIHRISRVRTGRAQSRPSSHVSICSWESSTRYLRAWPALRTPLCRGPLSSASGRPRRRTTRHPTGRRLRQRLPKPRPSKRRKTAARRRTRAGQATRDGPTAQADQATSTDRATPIGREAATGRAAALPRTLKSASFPSPSRRPTWRSQRAMRDRMRSRLATSWRLLTIRTSKAPRRLPLLPHRRRPRPTPPFPRRPPTRAAISQTMRPTFKLQVTSRSTFKRRTTSRSMPAKRAKATSSQPKAKSPGGASAAHSTSGRTITTDLRTKRQRLLSGTRGRHSKPSPPGQTRGRRSKACPPNNPCGSGSAGKSNWAATSCPSRPRSSSSWRRRASSPCCGTRFRTT